MSWLYKNSLSVVLFGLFLIFLAGLSLTGLRHQNQEALVHLQPPISYAEYIRSGEFVEAVFENWESEFLQMWALVMLTIVLRQKGSADSKKLNDHQPTKSTPQTSTAQSSGLVRKARVVGRELYGHSLGLALLSLFLLSFVLHAAGGASAYNEEAMQHGLAQVSVWQYLGSAQFWFESFQNWQSEFLAVGALLVLSIFLRERGSPESKAVSEPNSKTGRD